MCFRIMVLHLKRYGYSTLLSKRRDHIRIPRFINTGQSVCLSFYQSICQSNYSSVYLSVNWSFLWVRWCWFCLSVNSFFVFLEEIYI